MRQHLGRHASDIEDEREEHCCRIRNGCTCDRQCEQNRAATQQQTPFQLNEGAERILL